MGNCLAVPVSPCHGRAYDGEWRRPSGVMNVTQPVHSPNAQQPQQQRTDSYAAGASSYHVGSPVPPDFESQLAWLQQRQQQLAQDDADIGAFDRSTTPDRSPPPAQPVNHTGPAIEPMQDLSAAAASIEHPTPLELEAEEAEEPPTDWKLGDMIGEGAFGSVYIAFNNIAGRLMAVKRVRVPGGAAAARGKVAKQVADLEMEIRTLQRLKHPNIVRYLGSAREEEHLDIFLEYVPGGSIASLLSKFGEFNEAVIRSYTKQILLGLAYLHAHKIMHRDIKGANLLVTGEGQIKLADFGASKRIENIASAGSVVAKSLRGTAYWMAPEVIKQTGHGRPIDIWSVGCTVIEMATGRPPWCHIENQACALNGTVTAIFHIASALGPPPLPEHLSPEGRDFLRCCLQRNPQARSTAAELLQHPFLQPLPASVTVRRPQQNSAPAVTPARAPIPSLSMGGLEIPLPGVGMGGGPAVSPIAEEAEDGTWMQQSVSSPLQTDSIRQPDSAGSDGVRIESEGATAVSDGVRVESEAATVDSDGVRIESEGATVDSEAAGIDSEGIRAESEGVRIQSEDVSSKSEDATPAAAPEAAPSAAAAAAPASSAAVRASLVTPSLDSAAADNAAAATNAAAAATPAALSAAMRASLSCAPSPAASATTTETAAFVSAAASISAAASPTSPSDNDAPRQESTRRSQKPATAADVSDSATSQYAPKAPSGVTSDQRAPAAAVSHDSTRPHAPTAEATTGSTGQHAPATEVSFGSTSMYAPPPTPPRGRASYYASPHKLPGGRINQYASPQRLPPRRSQPATPLSASKAGVLEVPLPASRTYPSAPSTPSRVRGSMAAGSGSDAPASAQRPQNPRAAGVSATVPGRMNHRQPGGGGGGSGNTAGGYAEIFQKRGTPKKLSAPAVPSPAAGKQPRRLYKDASSTASASSAASTPGSAYSRRPRAVASAGGPQPRVLADAAPEPPAPVTAAVATGSRKPQGVLTAPPPIDLSSGGSPAREQRPPPGLRDSQAGLCMPLLPAEPPAAAAGAPLLSDASAASDGGLRSSLLSHELSDVGSSGEAGSGSSGNVGSGSSGEAGSGSSKAHSEAHSEKGRMQEVAQAGSGGGDAVSAAVHGAENAANAARRPAQAASPTADRTGSGGGQGLGNNSLGSDFNPMEEPESWDAAQDSPFSGGAGFHSEAELSPGFSGSAGVGSVVANSMDTNSNLFGSVTLSQGWETAQSLPRMPFAPKYRIAEDGGPQDSAYLESLPQGAAIQEYIQHEAAANLARASLPFLRTLPDFSALDMQEQHSPNVPVDAFGQTQQPKQWGADFTAAASPRPSHVMPSFIAPATPKRGNA